MFQNFCTGSSISQSLFNAAAQYNNPVRCDRWAGQKDSMIAALKAVFET